MRATLGHGVLAARDGLLPAGAYESADVTVHPAPRGWSQAGVVLIAHADPDCYLRACGTAFSSRSGPGAVAAVLEHHEAREAGVPGLKRCSCLTGPDLDDVDEALHFLGAARVRARAATDLTHASAGWATLDAATVAERHAAAFVNAVLSSGHGPWGGSLTGAEPASRAAYDPRARRLLDCAARLDAGAAAAGLSVADRWPVYDLAVACSGVADPQVVWVPMTRASRLMTTGAAPVDLPALSVLAASPVVATSEHLVVVELTGSAHAALTGVCDPPAGVEPRPGIADHQWAVALGMLEGDPHLHLDVALDAAGHALLVA